MKNTPRKKQDTRDLLLDSAFNTIYKHGFQGANVADILTDVSINKGSMYHYFKSKKELALTVVVERIEQKILTKYTQVLNEEEAVVELFNTLRTAPEALPYGCPLGKLAQEMLYIDDDFKIVLSKVYSSFEQIIEKILEKKNVPNSKSNAKLIIATYEGALLIYHLNQKELEFKETLNSLEKQLS